MSENEPLVGDAGLRRQLLPGDGKAKGGSNRCDRVGVEAVETLRGPNEKPQPADREGEGLVRGRRSRPRSGGGETGQSPHSPRQARHLTVHEASGHAIEDGIGLGLRRGEPPPEEVPEPEVELVESRRHPLPSGLATLGLGLLVDRLGRLRCIVLGFRFRGGRTGGPALRPGGDPIGRLGPGEGGGRIDEH
jgi:hypothetical protein